MAKPAYVWDGTTWISIAPAIVNPYPSQTGNSGKYLKTDGVQVSWATVDALPSQTGNSGKYLTTNGTSASWEVLSAVSKLGGDTITASGSSIVPLTIQGASGQTAFLQIWENHSGTDVATLAADGAFSAGSITATSLTINGDLTVNGTTTTINSTTLTLDDPIITLGGDSAPVSDDNKDRGVEFRYFDTQARIGFMGYDDSAGEFVFLTNATNTSEVFSGTKATINANISGSNINAGTVLQSYIDSAIARLSSPAFTGTPTAPTATQGTNTTQVATTEFVQKALEITQIDTFTFDGRTTRFRPTYLGNFISIDHPLRLLLNINGIMQIVAEKPSTTWLSGLASVGYYIDDDGYIVLPEPPEPGSYFEARLFPGVDLQARPPIYPFKAIDIYLGD